MNRQEAFEDAYEKFVPEPNDADGAILFYRAFCGLMAAWGIEFCVRYDHVVHRAACECCWFNKDKRYTIAVSVLRNMIDSEKIPEEPRPSQMYYYVSSPVEPTEEDAYKYFKEEFHEHFPGKRINSKFAKEKWIEKKNLAMEIVRNRYEDYKRRYDNEQWRLDEENKIKKDQWMAKIKRIEEFKKAAKDIMG